ncbi:MAG TPA: sigma-70 family RNA polymerase sigma factor [Candidatus Limnocylindrales bacterium]|nr:sigma-70 family RNA polymerase sigma factor [Candidatus Limnocylindrales bacterium]
MEQTDTPPSPEASARQADVRDCADMERLATGDDAALNDLMERHATPVFHFLCRMLGNEDDANDLAQETFVRVFRACTSFRTNEKFSTWLYTIAANLARNHFRWRSRHPNISLEAEAGESEQSLGSTIPAGDPAPNEQALAAERAAAVRAAVGRLPEDLREAIILCEWEERSVAEAAVILETTPKAVESRLYRARQILRERLKSWL